MKIANVKKETVIINKVTGTTYLVTETDGSTATAVEYDMSAQAPVEDGEKIVITESNDLVYRGIIFPEREIPEGFSIDGSNLLKDGEVFTNLGEIKLIEQIGAVRGKLIFKAESSEDGMFDIVMYDVNRDNFKKAVSRCTEAALLYKNDNQTLFSTERIVNKVREIEGKETQDYVALEDAQLVSISTQGIRNYYLDTPVSGDAITVTEDKFEAIITVSSPYYLKDDSEILVADEAERSTLIIRFGINKSNIDEFMMESFRINAIDSSYSCYDFNKKGLVLFSEDEFIFEKAGMSSGKTPIIKELLNSGCKYLIDVHEVDDAPVGHATTYSFTNADFSKVMKFSVTYRSDRGCTYEIA